MRLTLFMAMSINGIIATPDNKEDFLSHDNWHEFVRMACDAGCFIYGRKTYEQVISWEKEYLEPFEKVTKVVVSSDERLKLEKGWIRASSPIEVIKLLEEKGLSQVILAGGSRNNAEFAKLGLIDEVIVDLEGVIIGKGIPLFAADEFNLDLQLVSCKNVGKSIVQLRYLVLK